jgi:hypothetical protein
VAYEKTFCKVEQSVFARAAMGTTHSAFGGDDNANAERRVLRRVASLLAWSWVHLLERRDDLTASASPSASVCGDDFDDASADFSYRWVRHVPTCEFFVLLVSLID